MDIFRFRERQQIQAEIQSLTDTLIKKFEAGCEFWNWENVEEEMHEEVREDLYIGFGITWQLYISEFAADQGCLERAILLETKASYHEIKVGTIISDYIIASRFPQFKCPQQGVSVIPVTLLAYGGGHATILLVDHTQQIIEVFEPNAVFIMGENLRFETAYLDKLRELLSLRYPEYILTTSDLLCPQLKAGQPNCAAWSVFYVWLRIVMKLPLETVRNYFGYHKGPFLAKLIDLFTCYMDQLYPRIKTYGRRYREIEELMQTSEPTIQGKIKISIELFRNASRFTTFKDFENWIDYLSSRLGLSL